MVKKVGIDTIKENPNNPKTIDWFKLEQLKKSLKEFPDMMEIRPIVVDRDGVIVGGNMRWKAAKELSWSEVWVSILEDSSRADEFLVKDNLSYGEWNWEGLSSDYASDELLNWGLDVPLFFRDEDMEMGFEGTTEQEQQQQEKEQTPKSTKKAHYYFFTAAEKEELMDILRRNRGTQTNEEWILEKIRFELDGNSKG